MNILGIDPGLSGGAVLLSGTTPRHIVKYTSERDFVEFVRLMRDANVHSAFIEKVGAMPKQGVSSTWKFAQNYGFLRGTIRSFGIPLREVTPNQWQRGLGLPKRSKSTKTQHKRNLLDACHRLLPGHPWTHATGDAALIALYGYEHLNHPGGQAAQAI